ncbi:MAG: protoporphyrinogen oxidase, partial [Rhodospirillales bacterium]
GRRVVVLERQVRAGGNAVSERIGGFLMEHGPSSLSASPEESLLWSRELGLEPRRLELGPGVRRRYLVGGGGLYGIPTHPFGFLTSGYLSVGARLRMMAEIAVPRGRPGSEETVAAFCRRRFGAEFVERVVDPLVAGMFAGTAATLSMPATFPRLLEMELRDGSITRAVLRSRLRRQRSREKMPGRRLFSWRDGVGALPGALAARLGPAVKTGIAVRRIAPFAGGFRVEAGAAGRFAASAVVVATQPHVAAALLESIDATAAEAAAAIDAPPLAVVFLGYRREQVAHALDGLGYLTPRREGRALSGALFCSTMFAGRAPEGHVALAGYLGGCRAPGLAGLPAGELVRLARAEFHDLLGVRGDPVVARVRQWPRGLPQYRVGHGRVVAALRGVEQSHPGLFVTGNYFTGPGVAACLAEAKEAAARADGHLRRLAREAGTATLPAKSAWARPRQAGAGDPLLPAGHTARRASPSRTAGRR